MRKEGVPVLEASTRIDMTSHADHYPQITEAGVFLHGVQRVYDLMDGTGN